MEKPLKHRHPGENARSWEALGEARPGQSSLSAGALRYRAWAQSWSSAALVQRTDSFEKTLMVGKIEDRRRRGGQWMRWLDGITNSIDTLEAAQGAPRDPRRDSRGERRGGLACCSPQDHRVRHD